MPELPVTAGNAESSQPRSQQNPDYLQCRALWQHFYPREDLATLLWAATAQGVSAYGFTYRFRGSLQCRCATEGSQGTALRWVGAGPSGAARALSHLYLNPVPRGFPQCSPRFTVVN